MDIIKMVNNLKKESLKEHFIKSILDEETGVNKSLYSFSSAIHVIAEEKVCVHSRFFDEDEDFLYLEGTLKNNHLESMATTVVSYLYGTNDLINMDNVNIIEEVILELIKNNSITSLEYTRIEKNGDIIIGILDPDYIPF